ncbi:conserved predicted membrane protein [Phenylobacterium zucineum HLK1]|uniref:Protoporphyrinogen IX oxidase n=1 Tax=Phenylobacterium zucineum (strain HLK1) TaxID=450851 RepID=B4RD09_PHEZH|nr:CopD family protein [Phenylobacterium zucineum]ACG79941.1 conserved predicted membrane protein [Phenylobacterium zucineum HLK1]
MSWPEFLSYDLLRGLHIIAVIAWMAGMLYLPRLYAYHTETAPPGTEFDAHFQVWERKLLRIIINPAMTITWVLGVTLILWHVYATGAGWGFLLQPWMLVKLAVVTFLSGWHGFLAGARKKLAAGQRPKSAKFWRATNELPFVAAIVAVLAVTLQFGG